MIKSSLFILCLLTGTWSTTQDVQWRGPERDGKYPGTGLLKEWPNGSPPLILKKEGLGKGYSTPVLYDGMIYISGKRDSVDVLTCLDQGGDIHWETVYDRSWDKSYSESRNTPTIEDGRIYIMGGMGTVVCIDADTGEIIWQVNTHEEFEGEFHNWGMAESLLLTENAVISSPVGKQTALVALDKKDGSLIWETASVGGARSYVSPLLIDHNGRELILAVSSRDLLAVDPATGKIVWTYDLVTNHIEGKSRIGTVTPLYHNGEIFVTSGYDYESVMLTLSDDGSEVSLKYSDSDLDNHHGGVVRVGGYIYGSNWINNGNGNWVCKEWDTGKVMYDKKWHNKGSVIYADGMLYLYEEKRGHVGLVEATPEEFRLVSSFRIEEGSGPHWAHPSIYDRKLFIRHGEVLLVYDIAAE